MERTWMHFAMAQTTSMAARARSLLCSRGISLGGSPLPWVPSSLAASGALIAFRMMGIPPTSLRSEMKRFSCNTTERALRMGTWSSLSQ